MVKVFKNTLQKGSVRVIVYKEDDTWIGVALEFNITETGDDPEVVRVNLLNAIQGYLESAKKASLRPHVLNQPPDQEYEKLWQKLNPQSPQELIESPYNVYFVGTQVVTA